MNMLVPGDTRDEVIKEATTKARASYGPKVTIRVLDNFDLRFITPKDPAWLRATTNAHCATVEFDIS